MFLPWSANLHVVSFSLYWLHNLFSIFSRFFFKEKLYILMIIIAFSYCLSNLIFYHPFFLIISEIFLRRQICLRSRCSFFVVVYCLNCRPCNFFLHQNLLYHQKSHQWGQKCLSLVHRTWNWITSRYPGNWLDTSVPFLSTSLFHLA